ncbi:MAG: hypothetical protein ACRD0U_03155 [Acidimicrobiales bacterium]
MLESGSPSPAASRPSPGWRLPAGLVAAAAAGALGGLMLGEYDFSGRLALVAGPGFGVALAEVLITVARRRSFELGLLAGTIGAAGLLWAAWISSGHGLTPAPWSLGPGMALAPIAGSLWAGLGAAKRSPPNAPAAGVGEASGTKLRLRVRRGPGSGSR